MKNIRWHDFIVAGVIPGLIFGWSIVRGVNISSGVVLCFLLCYSIPLGIIYILNRNPGLVKDLEKGAGK